VDPLLNERKDSRTPLKKNRRRLDPTVEEEDNGSGSGGSGSTSPPIIASPRQEMRIKVRQISQGVEDISWKNMQHATYEEDVEIDGEVFQVTP
jgi:Ran-binding protein 3